MVAKSGVQVNQQQMTAAPIRAGVLQRACACGKHAEGGECASCKKKRVALQRTAIQQEAPDLAPPIVHEVLRSPGQPLDPAARSILEPRFEQDFSRVRVHTDARAAESAQAVQALAYTVGSHVVFGSAQYTPRTPEGQKLITHEMAHVVQQGMGMGSLPAQIAVGPVNDAYEQHADRAAGSMKPFHTAQAAPPTLQRQTTPGVHTSPSTTGPQHINYEKWGADVEASYRRAGLTEAANAVRMCREQGACDHLLTESEAWQMYRTGRITAHLGPPDRSGPGAGAAVAGAPLAVGALAQTSAAPAAEGGTVVAESALARASASWGSEAAIMSGEGAAVITEGAAIAAGGEGVAVVTEGAAVATGAAAGTVAVPVAVGVVLVLAVVDLVSWGRFQTTLRQHGYIILPNPLAVCIGSCHQPTRPSQPFREFPDFPPLTPTPFPPPGQISPDLERWIRDQSPRSGPRQTSPTQDVGPTAQPRPDPARRRRRRGDECIMQEAFPLGGNAEHDALAAFVTGQPVEYILSTSAGFLTARYDGKDAGDTLYEIKTRHDFLNLLDQPQQRLGPRGRGALGEGVPNLIAQIENQAMVAALCGYEYRIATNNPRILQLLRDLAPGVPVELVQFPWP